MELGNRAFNCRIVLQVLKATPVGFHYLDKSTRADSREKKKRQGLKFTGPMNSVLDDPNTHSEKSKGQFFPLVHV